MRKDRPKYDKKDHMELFEIKRDIAYAGKIGREREAFCIQYIRRKQERLDEISIAHSKTAAEKGEEISCHKGCSFCCLQYVEATIQECEAIVYYLYKEQSVLSNFLQKYPKWRKRATSISDPDRKIEGNQYLEIASDSAEKLQQTYIEEEKRYGPRVPCPFLDAQICSIYEVRPYACAALISTTPTDWCNPLNPNEPSYYRYVRPDLISGLSFYYGSLHRSVSSSMPMMVYGILKRGYFFLSKVTDFNNLEYEAMSDPEVRSILQKYSTKAFGE